MRVRNRQVYLAGCISIDYQYIMQRLPNKFEGYKPFAVSLFSQRTLLDRRL